MITVYFVFLFFIALLIFLFSPEGYHIHNTFNTTAFLLIATAIIVVVLASLKTLGLI